jgi:outer membrane receptor for ferrienterochelin and colicins
MLKQTIAAIATLLLCPGTAWAQRATEKPDTLLPLNELVVTGTFTPRALKDSPVLTKVISGNDIRQSGATTLLEALEYYIPGVSFEPNQAMGDNIQIQGLENKYVLILIDGERLVGERTEKVNLSRLNTGNIKQVEIINGAASALYGSNAIGSVVNIITRDVTNPFEGDARMQQSTYLNVTDASFGFRLKNFSSKTSFARKDMDTYTVKNTAYTAYPYEDYSLSQTLKYRTSRFVAELKGNYFRQKNWLLDKNQTRIDGNYTLGAKLQYLFSPNNHLTLSAHNDNYEGNLAYQFRPDLNDRANASQYTSFRLIDAWTINPQLQIVGGAEVNLEDVFSHNQFATQDKRYASNYNLFAQGEWKTPIGVEALVGIRYIRHSQFGRYASPNLSLLYRTDRFRFRGNVSNGFKAPTLKEMFMEFPHYIGDVLPFWIVGNPNLLPEESWYKALSAEYLHPKLNASITAYSNAIHNKINTLSIRNEALQRTEMKYENVESARISGIDLAIQYTFLKYFTWRGGYAYVDAIDRTTGQQLAGNSRHTATMNLQFAQPHLPFLSQTRSWPYNLLLSFRTMSPRTVYTETEGVLTELSTGNYYIGRVVYTQYFPIYKQLRGSFQFGINNLLNHVNRDFAAYNPGRTCFVGLGIRF